MCFSPSLFKQQAVTGLFRAGKALLQALLDLRTSNNCTLVSGGWLVLVRGSAVGAHWVKGKAH